MKYLIASILLFCLIQWSYAQPNRIHLFCFGGKGVSSLVLGIYDDSTYNLKDRFEWLTFYSEGKVTKVAKNTYNFKSSISSLYEWPYKIKFDTIDRENDSCPIVVINNTQSRTDELRGFLIINSDTLGIKFDSIINVVLERNTALRLLIKNEADYTTTSPNRIIMTETFNINKYSGRKMSIIVDVDEQSFLYKPFDENLRIKRNKLRWSREWNKECESK